MENNFLKDDVSNLGVNTPSAQEQFTRATEVIKSKMPHGIIPNAGIAGQILNGLAQSSFQETAQAQDVVTNAMSLNTAVGVQIDNLLNPIGVYRKKATSTYVEITVDCNIPSLQTATILAGERILNATTQDVYVTKSDTILYDGENLIVVDSISVGSIVCPALSQWSFYTYFSFIKSVKNYTVGSIGLPQESDFLYKYRHALYAGQQSRSGSYNEILLKLDNSIYIENYQLYENSDPYNYQVIVNTPLFQIPPSSYFIAIKIKDEYNDNQYWEQLTNDLGGERIQMRMIAPNPPLTNSKIVTVSANREFNSIFSSTATNTIKQLFLANYTIPIPKNSQSNNYFLGIAVKYTRYSTTPPLNTLLELVSNALYFNFYGVYPDGIPIPSPYRVFLGSTISAERFQVSLQALNIIGLETSPQLGEMMYDNVTKTFTPVWIPITNKQIINTTIFQNWRLLSENIKLVEQYQ